MASSRRHHQWAPRRGAGLYARVALAGWLAQPFQVQQRQALSSILDLGTEITDQGRKARTGFHAVSPSGPGKERGNNISEYVSVPKPKITRNMPIVEQVGFWSHCNEGECAPGGTMEPPSKDLKHLGLY